MLVLIVCVPLVSRAGCGIRLYRFIIIAIVSTPPIDQSYLSTLLKYSRKLSVFVSLLSLKMLSKKISNDQELTQSNPILCPQNQKGFLFDFTFTALQHILGNFERGQLP